MPHRLKFTGFISFHILFSIWSIWYTGHWVTLCARKWQLPVYCMHFAMHIYIAPSPIATCTNPSTAISSFECMICMVCRTSVLIRCAVWRKQAALVILGYKRTEIGLGRTVLAAGWRGERLGKPNKTNGYRKNGLDNGSSRPKPKCCYRTLFHTVEL